MKRFRKTAALFLALLLPLLLLTGCQKEKGGLEKISVCEVTHSIFYAPQYVAEHLGFFEEEGLQAEFTNGQGADAVMSAVLSGSADIGFAGPEASIYVYNEGKEDFTQVFAQMTQCDGSFLVAREPDPEFTWDKVRGKVILPGRVGGVPYMTLEYVLRKNGIDPASDTTLDSSVQFSLMTSAFTSGTGDYVTIFEPTASQLEAEGRGYIVASVGADSGKIPFTAYFAKKSFLEKKGDVIQRFTNAIQKGLDWVQTHSAEEIAQAVAPSFPDVSLELLTASVKSYQEIGAWKETPVMKKEAFALLQEVMTQAGELKKEAPFDSIVNNTFAEKASQQ